MIDTVPMRIDAETEPMPIAGDGVPTLIVGVLDGVPSHVDRSPVQRLRAYKERKRTRLLEPTALVPAPLESSMAALGVLVGCVGCWAGYWAVRLWMGY